MKMKTFVVLSIVTLLLAAFAGPVSAQTTATYTSFLPLVDHTANFCASSTSASSIPASSTSASIIPASSTSTSSASLSSSSYSPQPTDAALTRDKVFIDLENSRLLVSATRPVKVEAIIAGYLPDPCHVLRVVVGAATVSNTININVYSLFNKGTACITVLQPFSVNVPIGTFSSGTYTVMVNGLRLGSFSAGPAITGSK